MSDPEAGGEPRVLHVTLQALHLRDTKNFFCTVTLNEGMIEGGAKQRTEVSAVTDKPVFSSRSFQFASTVEWAENNANLAVMVMEAVRAPKAEGKKGSAKPYGNCAVDLAHFQSALEAGEAIDCQLDALPPEGNESTDAMGTVTVKLQLKDASESQRPGSDGTAGRNPSSTFDHGSRQYLSLQVRSAFNLPLTPEGKPPSVFVAVKTRDQEINDAPATTVVHGSRNPVWNQTLILECDPGSSTAVLAVVNDSTNSLLRKAEIPLDKLTVAQKYNLELALPPGDSRMYLQVCLHSLEEPPRFLKENPDMLRLEVDLGALSTKLLVPSPEVVAVLQLVSNEDSYVSSISRAVRSKTQLPQLPLRSVKSSSSWDNLSETLAGSRQASSATNGNGVAPEWSESFVFTQQRREVADDNSALAIEFFQRQGSVSPIDELDPGADKMKFIGFATQKLQPLFNDPRILNDGEHKAFDNVRVHLLGLPPSAVSLRVGLQQASVFIEKLGRLSSTLKVLPGQTAEEPERRGMLRNLCRLDLPLPSAIRAVLPPGVDGGSLVSHSFTVPTHQNTAESAQRSIPGMEFNPSDPTTQIHEISSDPDDLENLKRQIQERDLNIAVYRAQIADMRERETGLLEDMNRARQQAEQARQAPLSGVDLDGLDRDELEHRFSVLLRNYQTERKENEKLAKWLKQLRDEMRSSHKATQEHKRLQEAHLAQAEALKKLGVENKHLLRCKATMKDQEKVILKLEDLLDAAVRKGQTREAEMSLVAPDLQFKLDEAEAVIEQLRVDLGTALANGPADPLNPSSAELMDLEHEVNVWRSKAEMLQMRVEQVEAVLESVPRQWGSDMAKLQIQLKEKDAQLAGGFGSLANLKMGVGSGMPAMMSPTPPGSGGVESGRRGSNSRKGSAGQKPPLDPIRGGSAGQRDNPVSAAWDGSKTGAAAAEGSGSGQQRKQDPSRTLPSSKDLGDAYQQQSRTSKKGTPEPQQMGVPTPPPRSRDSNGRGSRKNSAGQADKPDKDRPWFLDAGAAGSADPNGVPS